MPGERLFRLQDFRIRALENDVAPQLAMAGTEINEVVRRANDAGFVLDHDHGVSQVAELPQNPDQSARVTRMQTDAGLIEHIERVNQARAQAGGQVHAFGFAAGQRARRAIEHEITEADLDQVSEARSDFVQNQADGIGRFGRVCRGDVLDEPQSIANGELVEIGEGD
ncbi:MAG: hypothetical protein DME19_11075 [Verrucomicrobia bacterium]|nr:MAG: hypothetical protein DME19_11075 [Verrucomicrobiota bacterium]